MKKILYLLATAATLLFAAACNREADNPDPAFGGKTVEATLSVALGEAPATKAYADGTTATKLLVFVYDAEKNLVASQSKTTAATAIALTQGQAEVKLRLVKGQKYSIAFWAQAEDAPYTVSTTDNKTLTVTATGNANAENRDAFYGTVAEFEANEDITLTKELTRPFAQVNVLLATQLTAAATSSMSVTGAPNTLNLATGEVSGSADYTLAAAAMAETSFNKEYETGKNYAYGAVNYILAPAGNGGTYDIGFELTCASAELGTIKLTKTVPTVPLKQNFRTNITWDPAVNADYTVIIKPGTGGDNDITANQQPNSFNVHIGGNTTPSASGVSIPLAIGAGQTLTILDANGKAPSTAVSEDTDIATVAAGNNAGEYTITGVADGKTNINFHIDAYTKVEYAAADFTVEVVVGNGGVIPEGTQTIAFSATEADATIGAAFTAPTLDVTGAKGAVTYSSSDPTVATVDPADGTVALVAAGSTVITATAAEATVEGVFYPEATASYTLTVAAGGTNPPVGATTIAAIKAAFNSEGVLASFDATFADVIVTYVNGKNAYIEDNTGGLLVYLEGHELVAGTTLSGTATLGGTTYNGLKEITAFTKGTDFEATSGATIPVTTLTIAQLNADFDTYESRRVKLEGVVNEAVIGPKASVNITQGTDAFILRPQVVLSPEINANSNIDVIGYPATFKTDKQFNVWLAGDITVNSAGDVATTISGMSNQSLTPGATYTFAATTNNPNGTVVYTIESGSDVVTLSGATVTVNANAAVGATAVIKASVAATTGYTAAEATATITVKDPGAASDATLTNAEIVAALSAGTTTGNSYGDMTISSASGTWTGNMNRNNSLAYVQIRNSKQAQLTTPVFSSNIEKIEVTVNGGTGNNVQSRKIFAVAVDTDLSAFGDKNYNAQDMTDSWTAVTKYGNVQTTAQSTNVEQTVTLTLDSSVNVKQVKLVAYDGAVYITSIKVYFK